MRSLILMILMSAVLTGCVGKFHRAEIATRAKTALIGMSKKDLLSCAGVPARLQQAEDLEFLSYVSAGDGVGVAVGGVGSSTAVGVIGTQKRYCEVTFILKDNRVQKVNYTGRTGGLATEGEQCAFVLENCLREK